jgi:immune inhibitor A
MEVDYDGGFVEVSTDGGATWTSLPDLDGFMTQNPLSGNNSDLNWVLTDQGSGVLRFDLSAYAGQVILFRLRYLTDIGVQWDGWWADDFSLDDGGANLFFDDVESGPGSWMTTSWLTVPLTNIYPRYYMAEWRNMSGFDRGLIYPYQTVYSDEDEWEVDRAAYTVPGMLLYYRDAAYRFDYTLGDSWYNPPSYGPKHGLIVIDSHSFPLMWDNYSYSSGQNVRLSRRVLAADATFTLKETTPFTLRLGYDPVTGEYLDTILETKTFESRPAVSQFHDSLGYYPGLWYQPLNDGLYFWDVAASAVVPAMGNYSTRITWPDDSPLVDLYGYDLGDTILGSGNPGDDLVQFGLHLAVINQAKDGRWGTIKVWNSMSLVDVTKLANTQKVRPGKQVKFLIEVRNTSPVSQAFVLDDPIPAGLTFVKGLKYDPETNSIHWADTLAPGGRKMIYYWAKVDPDTAPGTLIENVATVSDSALGDTASVTIEIIR